MVEASANAPGVAALAGVANSGQRFGRKDGAAGVTVVEVTGLTIASLAARKGQQQDLVAKVQGLLGVALPSQAKCITAGGVSALWSAPEQWLMTFSSGGRPRVAELAKAVSGVASVTDQSDSRAVIEVSGPKVRDMLAKGVMIDLHPNVFATGDTAVTPIAHIGAQITMINPAPVYQLLVPRSFCLSFWDWLISSGEEYGIAVQSK